MAGDKKKYVDTQIRKVEMVIELLQLNGCKPNEALAVAWSAFMNLFRQYSKNPTYENFTDTVQSVLKDVKDKWDDESL